MSEYTENIARKKFASWDHADATAEARLFAIPLQLISGRKPSQYLPDFQKEKVFQKFREYIGQSQAFRDRALELITKYGWHHNDLLLYTGLKKKKKTGLLKGITNVISDVAKLSVAPVTQAVSSVSGKPIDLKLKTGAAKTIGAIQETGAKSLNSLVKGFADTVTLGYATKAANLVRKDKYKEKAFKYNEMTPTQYKTGVKFLDKTAQILPAGSAAVGGAVAGVMGATKLGDLLKDGNQKPTGVVIGPNVLDAQIPTVVDDSIPLQASGIPINPLMIFGILVAIVILYFVAKKYK